MLKTKQIFNISETAKDFVPDTLARKSYIFAFFIVICLTSFVAIFFKQIPLVVPLFFTLPWGEARLAPAIFLYLLPTLILLFMLINLILGKITLKLSPLLPKVLAVTSAVIAIMFLIALFGIIQSLVL